MSKFAKRARRASFLADKKDPSLFEKHNAAQVVEVEPMCPICQEPIGMRSPEGVKERWSKLPCGHQFGSHCIKHYLRVVAFEDRPLCPICRQGAHHVCGHPVLPQLLVPAAATKPRERDMICGFCQDVDAARKAIYIPERKGLRALLQRLLSHDRGRSQDRRRAREAFENRGSMLSPEPGSNGPWLDPFPRARDPRWERWWDEQEPRQAGL